ncbi:hypothetical protein KO566_10190 [Flavobacteriaceae bacterium XHP0103]|uniref:hypothetical protein n=1 Tax=Marixanthotalea marina TaxID=2844359 RepID=UPI002989D214|nr:hypothetical protein [Marixanthotalea marina]MBU3822431.1 hypothetical protein [Marixanthotalea marina]
MKKIVNGITFITFILFIIWFISEPSYEPAIGILIAVGTLITILFTDRIKKIKKYIYTISVRGQTEKELRKFMIDLTKDFFEISGYKVPERRSEWKRIHIESKTQIDHEKLYNYVRENIGGKVYYVKGEGKSFGLITDEGPAKYF